MKEKELDITFIINFSLFVLLMIILSASCKSKADKVVHRRNFSKSFFEEEFAAVKIGCNQSEGTVHIPELKSLKIEKEFFSDADEKYVFKKGEKFKMEENTFKHELFLEEIKDSAFMFRYNSTLIDTLRRADSEEVTIQLTDDKGRVICRCDYLQ